MPLRYQLTWVEPHRLRVSSLIRCRGTGLMAILIMRTGARGTVGRPGDAALPPQLPANRRRRTIQFSSDGPGSCVRPYGEPASFIRSSSDRNRDEIGASTRTSTIRAYWGTGESWSHEHTTRSATCFRLYGRSHASGRFQSYSNLAKVVRCTGPAPQSYQLDPPLL